MPPIQQSCPFNGVDWLGVCGHSPLLDPLTTVVGVADTIMYRQAWMRSYRLNILAMETEAEKAARRRISVLRTRETRARKRTTVQGIAAI